MATVSQKSTGAKRPRTRIWFALSLAAVTLAQVYFFSKSHLDFVPHFEATKKILAGNFDIYPHGEVPAHAMVYSYSPFFPLTLAPALKFLSLPAAKVFWGVLSALCFLVLWWESEKIFETLCFGQKISYPARLCTLLIVLDPIHTNAMHGNITTVLGAIVWGALLCFLRGREGSGAWLAGLGIGIKLTPGFVLFVPLAQRRWRAVALTVATSAFFMVVLPAVLLGPAATKALYRDWWEVLRYVGTNAFDSPLGNQSPHAIFFRLFGNAKAASLLALVLSALFALLVLVATARERQWSMLLGAVGIGLTLQGIVWTKQHIWLLPFYLLFMQLLCEGRLRPKLRSAWIGYVILLYGTTPMLIGRVASDWTTYYGKYLWGLMLLALTLWCWEEGEATKPAPVSSHPSGGASPSANSGARRTRTSRSAKN